jgi:hypothetical protein
MQIGTKTCSILISERPIVLLILRIKSQAQNGEVPLISLVSQFSINYNSVLNYQASSLFFIIPSVKQFPLCGWSPKVGVQKHCENFREQTATTAIDCYLHFFHPEVDVRSLKTSKYSDLHFLTKCQYGPYVSWNALYSLKNFTELKLSCENKNRSRN